MRNLSRLLALPASLLLVLSTAPAQTLSVEPQWPYNLPPHVKYFPEDEPLVRKNAELQKRLVEERPLGVRKMTGDEGEMFFLEYWYFSRDKDTRSQMDGSSDMDKGSALHLREVRESNDGRAEWTNTSIIQLQPPFVLHSDQQASLHGRPNRYPRAVLGQRDFQCPGGTSNCASIGRPNSCCASGETCQLISDTGLGDVGCCAAGQCSEQVQGCQQGYTACPGSSGGGCCIPGYQCFDVGCVLTSTAIVVVVPTVTLSPTSRTTTTTFPATQTPSAVIVPLSSAFPSLTSSTPSSSSTITSVSPSTAPTPQSLTCSPNFRSCPASLGGGCCPADRACGSMVCPASTSSSPSPSNNVGVGVPVRPTSNDGATITSTDSDSAPSTETGSTCPTGFYQCSAYYRGNCCRVGRDCATSSCPPSDSTSVLVSNGITVVVATAAASGAASSGGAAPVANNAQKGSCAQGWFSCASSAGGGCCPNGYECGASCTATASGTGSVAKVATGGAAPRKATAWTFIGIAFGVAVVVL